MYFIDKHISEKIKLILVFSSEMALKVVEACLFFTKDDKNH